MGLWREQRASTTVLFGMMAAAMIGFAALAVDVGHLYNVRAHLSATADAAARAGAQMLPGDSAGAQAVAEELAQANGVSLSQVHSTISTDQTTITVNLYQTVPLTFARILYLHQSDVAAAATARNGVVSGVQGAVPFAVIKQSFSYGELVTLKQGAGSSVSPGNYQGVALGGRGANTYRDNISYGYSGWLHTGEWITTEPGNMTGPTRTGVQYRLSLDPHSTFHHIVTNSARVLKVPIVDSFSVHGRGEVLIVGFAAFFLESSQSSSSTVSGRFIRYLVDGEVGSGTYYGTGSVKLIE